MTIGDYNKAIGIILFEEEEEEEPVARW